jgi:hypothetical protein
MRTLGSSCCSLWFVPSTRLTFKTKAGQHIRLVRALVLVRAGKIEHCRYPPAFPVRLVAQGHPELGRLAGKQPGQLPGHLLGDQGTEAFHVQLDPDAGCLAQDFSHCLSFLVGEGGSAAAEGRTVYDQRPHAIGGRRTPY